MRTFWITFSHPTPPDHELIYPSSEHGRLLAAMARHFPVLGFMKRTESAAVVPLNALTEDTLNDFRDRAAAQLSARWPDLNRIEREEIAVLAVIPLEG